MRNLGIWVTGLLASSMFGFLIGIAAAPESASFDQGMFLGFYGLFGGPLAFTCFRLWKGGE